MLKLRPFQRRFVAGVFAPSNPAMRLFRLLGATGKSWLRGLAGCRFSVAWRAAVRGWRGEHPALGQLRSSAVCVPLRKGNFLGTKSYSYTDSTNKIGIRHKSSTNTRLVGEVEPGKGRVRHRRRQESLSQMNQVAWDAQGGAMMSDALDTAIGKAGTDLRVVYIGTLAPSRSGWWSDLISDGSGGSTYVQSLQGDLKRWDQWSEIRRC